MSPQASQIIASIKITQSGRLSTQESEVRVKITIGPSSRRAIIMML
jgi:hypothetical protein